jgi:superfamily II RNA helicase
MRGSDDMDIDDTMLPAIVFTLSRKQVEESAHELTANILAFDSKIPYTAAHECEQVLRRLPNWREYAELPEYKALVRLLEKGVGIHHSGMIPVLREIVELRISEKKIFMLFATESFAIGLDCPIRTAVFTGVTKFDGSEDRFFYAHEYTQMAGRAGRRGIDTVGNVIHLPLLFRKGMPSELAFRDILSNKPQILVSKFHIDYKMVLSLLKKGVSSDFHLFAERSMSKTNLEKETEQQSKYLAQVKHELNMLRTGLQHIRTPLDICKEYEGLQEQIGKFANKKRKEIERRMVAIKDQHKYILEDMRLFAKVNSLETILSQTETELRTTASYLRTQTDQVCSILSDLGVIFTPFPTEEDKYELSAPLGLIAAQFAEVHPVPLANLILKTRWFKGWTAKQLVGLLSVFVDVRLPEHLRVPEPQCADHKVKEAIEILDEFYDEIRHEEITRNCYTGVVYEGALCLDMTDTMMEWCDLSEEVECKTWLQDLVASNVSAGDFAKACMKLSATAKEIIAMCDALGPVEGSEALELAHVLSSVDALILKHIATTQSLYL